MEQFVETWCNLYSIPEYSIPNIKRFMNINEIGEWIIREEDRDDHLDWFPIFSNCTGTNYCTYYYNVNKDSSDHGKILGLWTDCYSEHIEFKMVGDSIDEFLENPKYQSLIARRNDYDNGIKISLIGDGDL